MAAQQTFRERLHQVVEKVESRLASIRKALDERASQSPELAEALQEPGGWYERLQRLQQMVEDLKAKAEVRQSLVVVGKRGQGKSSLIRNWLSGGVGQNPGHNPLPLPTGVDETTCALVRLTSLAERDHSALEVRMLPETALAQVTHRPPRPILPDSQEVLVITRDSPEATISAFSVMRYPVEKTDTEVYLQKQGNRYVLSRTSSPIPLTAIQYHAAEVIVPLAPEELTGRTRQLLEILDVVDAPGADPAGRGSYPDWMRHKSQEVFRLGSPRIDLLLLVSSCEVAAVNLGGQMQAEILQPWRERCQGRTQGRLLIVITHAADLLQDVSGEGSRVALQERSPTRRLVGNVLEPLDNLGFLDLDAEPDDWPPIFFVENERQQLEPFLADWSPDPTRVQRLLDLLGQGQEWADLSRAEQCILKIAADWEQEYGKRWSLPKIRRLQRWTIRALCHLLDEHDQGLGLLTQFLLDWGSKGPVACNYLMERIEMYERFEQQYYQFLSALNEPDFHGVLRELEAGRAWLRQHWPQLGGINWKVGQRTRQRLQQAERNASPDSLQRQSFQFADVLQDLVEDALEQMEQETRTRVPAGASKGQASSAPPAGKDWARTALLQCLANDWPMRQMQSKYEQNIERQPLYLARVQVFGWERITRIIDFLVHAPESQLRLVLRHCYRKDLTQNTIIRGIYDSIVQPHEANDKQALNELSQLARELRQQMQSWSHLRAY
ncbi:hypothetical protein HRbin36_00148 [bacterium HR36]|nr:hypothetical protein HRbin36_00148 [bacterium HR36]